jgi:hypothetical protein
MDHHGGPGVITLVACHYADLPSQLAAGAPAGQFVLRAPEGTPRLAAAMVHPGCQVQQWNLR